MTLFHAIFATFEISKVMVPPIIIGFFVASVIRRSPYFRYLTMPTAWLASIARLPAECSAALTLFLVNSWAALALLSEAHKNRQINDRELMVAVLVGFIPKGLHGTLFFSLPVGLSVLGPRAGGLYVCLDLLANFFVAGIGILAARMMLAPRISMTTKGDEAASAGDWKVILRDGLHECISSSIKIIRVLVPTIFLAQLAIEYVLVLPIVERYNEFIEPSWILIVQSDSSHGQRGQPECRPGGLRHIAQGGLSHYGQLSPLAVSWPGFCTWALDASALAFLPMYPISVALWG